MELIFATGNENKAREVRSVLPNRISLKTLSDIEFHDEIEEVGKTLAENAIIKATTVHNFYRSNVFAEDTGLEVNALNGAPGVYTARYGGPSNDADKNMSTLLDALKNHDDRAARFRTVVALILDESLLTFEGILEGEISLERRGNQGFGYDPLFVPKGYSRTLAQLSEGEKNLISHRKNAIDKLVAYLSDPINRNRE